MSFLAQVTYTGNGSTTQYSITFPFLDSSHVKAFINGVATTDFTISSSTLTFTTAPANSAVVRIERQTPIDTRIVDFTDGSVLTESDLDKSADQNFYVAQEITDESLSTIKVDTDDKFDAQSKVIKNVSNPVNDNDAVNKTYLENTWLSTANKTALTTVNANISNINAVNSNSTNINTVSGSNTAINTVATNIGSVNTVATDISKVIAVANDLAEAVSEVETVADDLNETTSEIDTVATNIANVNTVGNAIANVNSVATNISNVNAVNSNSTNINAVNANSSNINTVAGQNANITTLAGISSNITTVAGISSDVTAVNNNSTNINAVAGNSTNINAVNSNSSNINSVASNATNINTVATNVTDVNTFANRYRIGSADPTTSLDAGDLFFNTTSNTLRFYNGTAWADIDTGIQTETDPTAIPFSLALG
jgi:hypothetical protein